MFVSYEKGCERGRKTREILEEAYFYFLKHSIIKKTMKTKIYVTLHGALYFVQWKQNFLWIISLDFHSLRKHSYRLEETINWKTVWTNEHSLFKIIYSFSIFLISPCPKENKSKAKRQKEISIIVENNNSHIGRDIMSCWRRENIFGNVQICILLAFRFLVKWLSKLLTGV